MEACHSNAEKRSQVGGAPTWVAVVCCLDQQPFTNVAGVLWGARSPQESSEPDTDEMLRIEYCLALVLSLWAFITFVAHHTSPGVPEDGAAARQH